jgi:hypothetical protein
MACIHCAVELRTVSARSTAKWANADEIKHHVTLGLVLLVVLLDAQFGITDEVLEVLVLCLELF